MSGQLKKFWRAQHTILHWLGAGVKPKGFYIPYRYADTVQAPKPGTEIFWLKQELASDLEKFVALLDFASQYNSRFQQFQRGNPASPQQPRFNQDWFPGLDGAMAYAMVQKFHPRKILEIGSGHSTRFLAQAIRDSGNSCHLHSIDPQPRREIDGICSQVTRAVVAQAPRQIFSDLAANDILFIDCSHIAMPGTDVDYLFTELLPILRDGVIVHIHDIFLPNGYPADWAWRSYNEQNFLLAMLGAHGRYATLFPNAYLRRYHPLLCEKVFAPRLTTAKEGSYWLQIRPR